MTSTQKKMLRYVTIRLKWKTGLSVCGGGERCTLSSLSPGQTRKHCCRNICDSRCFLKCFPVCPPVETLLRKQNLLPEKQKCFLANSETFDVSLCFSLMFPIGFAHSWKHCETLVGNNVSATMFPSLPRALLAAES